MYDFDYLHFIRTQTVVFRNQMFIYLPLSRKPKKKKKRNLGFGINFLFEQQQ